MWRSFGDAGLTDAPVGLNGIVLPLQGKGRVAGAFLPGALPWADLWLPLRGDEARCRNIKTRQRGSPEELSSLALRVGMRLRDLI
jgi:hypothetical protein